MAIAVTCPSCGVRVRFKNEHLGKTGKCRACAKPLAVQGDAVPDYDVFISYSMKDKRAVDAVCTKFESKRIRCWVAPRDILPGKPWAGAILDAIADTRIMVLIFSVNSNISPQVLREVDRAVSHSVIIIPFMIEATPLSKEMEYYISTAHWLDASTPPLEQHIAKLVDIVHRFMAGEENALPPTTKATGLAAAPQRRMFRISLAWAAIALVAVVTPLSLFLIMRGPVGASLNPDAQTNSTSVPDKPVPSETGVPHPTSSDIADNGPKGGVGADAFQAGSVWTAQGGGQHGHKWTITIAVVERNGNNFKARFEGPSRSGEIQGTVKDGKIAWTFDELDRGKKSSGETSGTIGQEEISITKHANGGPAYALTLKK